MAKRRTRAQKQRAAQRRQQQLKAVVAKIPTFVSPKTKITKTPALKEPVAPTQPLASSIQPPTLYRQRDLVKSLSILGSLIGLQVLVRVVFHFTKLDDSIYNWIKL
ncbi:hypothetical protein HY441_01845 [Candidatus Microgenomates bacterium]|nr:hypothetical protein [Candidatus Microgenomates bacterium]